MGEEFGGKYLDDLELFFCAKEHTGQWVILAVGLFPWSRDRGVTLGDGVSLVCDIITWRVL